MMEILCPFLDGMYLVLNDLSIRALVGTQLWIDAGGGVGIGTDSPTAGLHFRAGTAAASTAPLKLTAGTNLTTPEAGAVEDDGTSVSFTDSTAARRLLATLDGSQTLTNKELTVPTITSYTVAGLPAAGTAGRIAIVTDGDAVGDCTTGGGSSFSFCRDTGAAWTSLGDLAAGVRDGR